MRTRPALPRRLASLLVLSLAILTLPTVSGQTPPADATGSPDISLSTDVQAETLHGGATSVTLTARNPTKTPGYNASVRAVLPVGVTYDGSPFAPTQIPDAPTTGQTTLIWSNITDILPESEVSFTFTVKHDTSRYVVGDTFSIDAGVYVNSDERTVPDFDPDDGTPAGDSTGWATGDGSTVIIPFLVEKSEPSPESELLRGLHDHQTVFTIAVTNNHVGPTTGLTLEDWLPAGLEFLGCGTEDNSTVVPPGGTIPEEYLGSGQINPGNAPATTNCLSPDTVETVDSPAGLPGGVYTHIVWHTALGGVSIPKDGVFEMDYVAAIPMRENTTRWDGAAVPPTGDGSQGSNIDNNNGKSTEETIPEGAYTNYVSAHGTYAGRGYIQDGEHTVFSEDVAMYKTVSTDTIVSGDMSDWTLHLRVSEYAATVDALVVQDVIPDGLKPVSSEKHWTTHENADGTWDVSWNISGGLSANDTFDIVYTTKALFSYKNGDPVLAGDSWHNDASLTASIDGRLVGDETRRWQHAPGTTSLKEVAKVLPASGTCGDGTGITWLSQPSAPQYSPGDRVCWRITVTTPGTFVGDFSVVDFLPPGFTYESWNKGATTLDSSEYPADPDETGQALRWNLGGTDNATPPNETFQAVISSIAGGPEDFADSDLVGNLLKTISIDTGGEVSGDRADADIAWSSPVLELTKSADATEVVGGQTVHYTLDMDEVGTGSAANIEVWDLLPPEFSCTNVSGITDGGSCKTAESRIEWLLSDESDLTVEYDLVVPSDVAPSRSFTNEAGIRSYTSNTNDGSSVSYYPENNIDPALPETPNVPPARDDWTIRTPDALIVKSRTTGIDEGGNAAANQATIGEIIAYTVTVTVPAGTTVRNAAITDTVNGRLEYRDDASATFNGGSLPTGFTLDDAGPDLAITFPDSYSVPPSGSDAVFQLTFSARVLDVAENTRTQSVPNRANFDWTDERHGTHNLHDGASTQIVEPDLHITKSNNSGDGIVLPGEILTYTLEVTNPSSTQVATAHDVVVTDIIPNQLTPVDGGGNDISDGGNVPPDGGTWTLNTDAVPADSGHITWAIPSLAPDASVTLTYRVRADDPLIIGTEITNTATVTGSSLSGNYPGVERDASSPYGGSGSGYQDTDQNTVVPPGVRVTKLVTPGAATVGEEVEYTVELVLPKDLTVYDATIIDQLPTGVTVDGVDVGTTYGDYTLDWSCTGCRTGFTVTELTPANGNVGWWLGELRAATVDRTLTIHYRARIGRVPEAVDGATLTNTVAGFGNSTPTFTTPPTEVPDPGTYDVKTDDARAVVGIVEPHLTLTKEVDDGGTWVDARRALPNESLDYRIIVTNDGTSPAYNTVVRDRIATHSGDAMLLGSVVDGPGYTVRNGDPSNGRLRWVIPGPINPGHSVTITYTLVVWDAGTADENPTGPEITNTAVSPRYWGVPRSERRQHPTYEYRRYRSNADTVDIELDLASVGDFVWYDVNGDGIQDAGEPGIPGVDVNVVYDGPGGDETHTATTDAHGTYLVEDLPGGGYTATVDPTTLPGGLTPSYDLDGGDDGTTDFTLAEDANKTDVDFGYTGTGSIGDTVWLDRNGSGHIDSAEPGIDGVELTVTFYGFDGAVGGGDDVTYPAVTTASGGLYGVARLPYGHYHVAVDTATLPADLDATYDLDAGLDSQTLVDLSSGQPDRDDVDFGYRGRSSVGDRVWLDLNRNGVEDPGEPGLDGVTITARWPGPDGAIGGGDDVDLSMVTGADGLYLFGGLNPGSYPITVDPSTLPAGVTPTYDEDGVLDHTTNVTLPDNTNHLTADFGYGGEGTIGDFVWWDRNGDGVQDTAEPGIPGARVSMYWFGPNGIKGDSDDLIRVTTTGPNGEYVFDTLPGGTYEIEVYGAVLGVMDPTFDLDGTLDNTATVALGLGEQRLDVDFGYNGTNSIGDTVWWDRDGDGVQASANEPGIVGVDVGYVWFGINGVEGDGDDVALPGLTTDATGMYLYAGVPDGNHRVTITGGVPAGMSATYDEDGGLDETTGVAGLTGGANHLTADFGYRGDSEIGDTVWWDLDRDGVQDPGEPGLSGVGVTLTWPGPDGALDTLDDLELDAVTDVDGLYLFGGLNPGLYRVEVDPSTLPARLTQTYDEDGVLDHRTEVDLAAADSHLTADFGYGGEGTIGDFVWWDRNGDGVQDTAEPGIPGVAVELSWAGRDGTLGTADDVSVSGTTDASGLYLFANLPEGTFTVSVAGTLPTVMDPTFDLDGTLDNTATVVLALGEQRLDVDFGYNGTNGIGDTVWYDIDADGVQDTSEPGIPSVTVELLWAGPDEAFGTADDVALPGLTTDATGMYLYAGVPDGNHRVTITGGVPAGMSATYDEDGGLDETTVVAGLTGGVNHLTADFGYTGTGSMGDTVWWDLDRDGTKDFSEPDWRGIGITVTWAGFDGTLGTPDDVPYHTVTRSPWIIDRLPAGPYRVEVARGDLPTDVYPTYDPDGGNDDMSELILAAGEDNLYQDFGYAGIEIFGTGAEIGDTVWYDVNADGVEDPGEPGVGSVAVTVTYLGADGVTGGGDDIVISYATDTVGHYLADGLVAGAYEVSMDESTLPDAFFPFVDEDGSDPTVTGLRLGIVEHRYDVDFGVVSASIGDTVWIDENGNGVKDATEVGVSSVSIDLFDGTGTVVATTTTDTAGVYRFTAVAPGTYTVRVDPSTIPDGFVQTYSRDGILNGATTVTVIGPGEIIDVDFGYQKRSLPITGQDIARIAMLGLLLLAAGAMLLAATRRRRRG